MAHWVKRSIVGAGPLVLGLGIVGCGSPGDEADDPQDRGADGTQAAGLDAEGFERDPVVAFPAPAVAVFGNGHLLCSELRSEIAPELATSLGYDVAGDRAALEATQVLDVLASWDDVRPTTVHYRGRITRLVFVNRGQPVSGFSLAEAVPVGCPSGVEYELVEQLYTEDGAVRGAFVAHVPATRLDDPTARRLAVEVDLRNFSGDLPVGWLDGEENASATGGVSWTVGAVAAPYFEFTPMSWGGPDSATCDRPICRIDGDLGLPMSYGVVTTTELQSFDDLLRAFPTYDIRTITEHASLTGAYTPNVRVWVTTNAANGADPSSQNRVHVTARAAGRQLADADLDLAADADRLPEGIVSGFFDIGPILEGTRVDLDVEDDFGLGNIRSHIVVDDCDIGPGTASCVEAGCKTATSLSIVPAGCFGAPTYLAR